MRFINVSILAFLFILPVMSYAQSSPDSCLSAYPFRYVVIGSSTAEGAGASTSDSAWVNRFRTTLEAFHPDNLVFNLARGGYNTYLLMPSDSIPPAGRPTPDTLRNITRALALGPDAIIINLPSNDAAAGYTLNEQLKNFDIIVQTATQKGVPIWVCTTQPRNFSAGQVAIQKAARDSILARYSNRSINFWEGLATPEGHIDPLYDSGDGIHLNNTGHRILFERVRMKNISTALIEIPEILVVGDTLCQPGSTTLLATATQADTIFWYATADNTSPFASGAQLITPVLDSTTTFYVEAVKGPFDYRSTLITTSPTNRDWNGVMFELQADTSLTLDSLTLRVQTSGAQTVRAFTHAGGLMGQENKPEEWEQLDTFPVLISKAGQWVTLPIGPVDLDKGDTLSLYLHLLNPDADLAYFAPTDTVVVQTPELRLRNSTGVSHTFGQTFNPRLYSGRIFYHFGFKPQGSCRSARIPVTVWISNPEIDLGPDSVLLVSDPLVLDAGPGWSAYQWSDGSMGQTKLIDHMMLEPGANLFSVTVTDHLGCPATDSVLVYYVPTDIREPEHTPEIRIRPNPGSTTFLLFSPTPLPEVSIDIFDAAGTRVYQTATTLPASLQSSFGPAGMYWIHIRGPRYQQMIKWIKIE